jgi:cbb3-type cytochrome oxidase subunit 3
MIDFLAINAGMIGLLFFFIVFSGVAIWAFLPSQKEIIEKNKYIPLLEDNHNV